MSLLSILKNRYFIIGALFVIWALFFAQYDVLSLRKQKIELADMQRRINYLEKEIEELQREKEALKTDPNAVERYSREKYFMKKSNEEVFVVDSTSLPKSKN